MDRGLRFLLIGAVSLLFPAVAGAAGMADGVSVKTLDNGLKIIVKPDRRAPVVTSMVWYRVGSVDEQNGQTGIAHVLEHMMFKGTPQVPSGEFSKRVAAAGGRENAFTSRDYTAYFQTLHKDRLGLALQLEADRMQNLLLSADEFKKEIRVVMEERRWRVDDRPQSVLYERLLAAALNVHPYRNPIIGWMNDLENLTIEDTRAFYERWYAPNNAILVIVGDVSAESVFALAQESFGSIPAKTLPARKPQEETEPLGIKRLTVKAPAELPMVMMAYRVPRVVTPAEEWEPYAFDMLEGVLSGNAAARLNRTLVNRDRIATSASAGYDGVGRGPAFFYLNATPIPGKTVAEAEAALRRELRRILDEGVSDEELERVKSQAIAAQIYQRDSMFYQGRLIGSMEAIGLSYRDLDVFVEKLQSVTAAQVQDVVRRYLTDDRLTVAYLDPQPLAGKPRRAPAGVRHDR